MNLMTHVKKKFKLIGESILKIKLNNNGFTLIEAIITIAIVGIIVTPISMVFLGSLNDTVEAKEMLKANQMAQLYVENLKMRSVEEIEDLFLSSTGAAINTITIDETSMAENAYLNGLPAIPQNFRVELSIDRTIYESNSEFEVSKPAEDEEITSLDADVYVDIGYNAVGIPTIYFYHYTDLVNSFYSEPFSSANGVYEYEFVYEVEDVSNNRHVYINQLQPLGLPIDDDLADPEAGINLNPANDDILVINADVLKKNILDNALNDTEVIFTIQEMNSTTCSAFILRESEDYVSPIIETQNGLVVTNYNIMDRNPADYFIGKIVINVINDNTNEVLATMSATKIYD